MDLYERCDYLNVSYEKLLKYIQKEFTKLARDPDVAADVFSMLFANVCTLTEDKHFAGSVVRDLVFDREIVSAEELIEDLLKYNSTATLIIAGQEDNAPRVYGVLPEGISITNNGKLSSLTE